jgi:hypothetical protein
MRRHPPEPPGYPLLSAVGSWKDSPKESSQRVGGRWGGGVKRATRCPVAGMHPVAPHSGRSPSPFLPSPIHERWRGGWGGTALRQSRCFPLVGRGNPHRGVSVYLLFREVVMMMKPLRREHLTAEGYKRPPEGSPTAGCIPPHPRHLSVNRGRG